MTYNKDAVIAIYDSKDAADTTNVNNVDKSGALAVWKSTDKDPNFSNIRNKRRQFYDAGCYDKEWIKRDQQKIL